MPKGRDNAILIKHHNWPGKPFPAPAMPVSKFNRHMFNTATTPPDKLVGLLEEHLAAAAAAAAESEERVALHQRQLFHPLPPLSPEQLPDMADPKYFIRVRQAAATLWASNAAPLVAQRSHNISAGASLAGLEVEKQAKRSERHHHAQQVAGDSATQPASDSATLLTRNEKSAADRAQEEGFPSLPQTTRQTAALCICLLAASAFLFCTLFCFSCLIVWICNRFVCPSLRVRVCVWGEGPSVAPFLSTLFFFFCVRLFVCLLSQHSWRTHHSSGAASEVLRDCDK
ncbi:hypothetical protein LBRM_29_2200 [Leishmania braziliensis MHOM/BR/75/M2904]|uniref:Transmembrane protein n=1 Tax=Leishmania braziliensis TaxID=5660 RepID=A4HHM2_LEIBR|nr:hypothetical protein LBRM_29_2200 [Leishmania braziliensis MHOM/BR/75/M2904]CAM40076.2 hypothetical protein LBRM_29_2200 [Leishmania braziliensis MHOM/BR/75/M2904]